MEPSETSPMDFLPESPAPQSYEQPSELSSSDLSAQESATIHFLNQTHPEEDSLEVGIEAQEAPLVKTAPVETAPVDLPAGQAGTAPVDTVSELLAQFSAQSLETLSFLGISEQAALQNRMLHQLSSAIPIKYSYRSSQLSAPLLLLILPSLNQEHRVHLSVMPYLPVSRH